MFSSFCIGIALCLAGMSWDADEARTFAAVLREAFGHVQFTMRRISQEAERDQGAVTRQVSCTEGLGRTLACQPSAVKQWLGVVLLARYGVPEELALVQQLDQAAADKRMARMTSAEQNKRTA